MYFYTEIHFDVSAAQLFFSYEFLPSGAKQYKSIRLAVAGLRLGQRRGYCADATDDNAIAF